jgi:two-component system, OmpR family, phosphate regulon sensor histidine kinase PhoR
VAADGSLRSRSAATTETQWHAMTLGDESGGRGIVAKLRSRVTPTNLVIAAAAAVFLALALTGATPPLAALAGFAVIAAGALYGRQTRRTTEPVPAPAESAATPVPAPALDALIAALPDPVVVLDRNGLVVAFNSGAGAIAPALRRGEPASLALRMPAVVDAIRRAVASGESQSAEFSERVPIDRWYAAKLIPVPSAPGDALDGRLLLTLHDLTPLRRSEEMRADFVANASHELRTPLASLSGFIDTLQGSARDDAAARERFLAIMRGQARRMARLIDDLLSLSRIELNAHIQPETPTDLMPIVQQVVDTLQMLARERGVEVAISGPPGPLTVLGDRDELSRVFENLVENAMKYGASGKRVDIVVARADASDTSRGEAVISVRDYGPGIAPEHLPRLTERFYRVDVGQSRAEGGTGLGLALVKHILNRHRGRLAIESTLGAGATFAARLPLAPDETRIGEITAAKS